MGEQMTPEQAAQLVQPGDPVLVTVRAYRGATGRLGYVQLTTRGTVVVQHYLNDVQSVELLPPEPKPGEWWFVRVEGTERVLTYDGDRWFSFAQKNGAAWSDMYVTPLHRMVQAGERGSDG